MQLLYEEEKRAEETKLKREKESESTYVCGVCLCVCE